MKSLITVFLLMFSLNSFAVWDMLVHAKPNRDYMNFFYKGYLPWFEKTFQVSLELPGKSGKEFFTKAVMAIDHWKVSGGNFDQLLIGETFKDGSPRYSISLYINPELRADPYIKSFKLSFSPDFVEYKDHEICFGRFTDKETVSFSCKDKTVEKHWQKAESKTFQNTLAGLAESEVLTTVNGKPTESLFVVKSFHMAALPKIHYPYVMKHGAATHMPIDKLSIGADGNWTIYYP